MQHWLSPVIILDDDDDYRAEEGSRDSREGSFESLGPLPSDHSDREGRFEQVLERRIAEVIDLSGEDHYPGQVADTVSQDEGETEVAAYNLGDTVLRPGLTVELEDFQGNHRIQFLRITSIVRHPRLGILLRGPGFVRTRHLRGMLPARLNEVAMIVDHSHSGLQTCAEQGLVDVSPDAVKRIRSLKVTNDPFPAHRFSYSELVARGKEWVEENGPLVCRCRFNVYFNSTSGKPCEWALVRIDEDTADPAFRRPDEQNLNNWRGGKVPGGSHNPTGSSRPVLDLESVPSGSPPQPRLAPGQRYTAGDVFAGAGGASRGIERAGVRLVFALDHWVHAAETLKKNFPHSRIYNIDVTDFITTEGNEGYVDILHLSPPCQFWSPAHTVAGKNDEHNIAVLFACTDLIQKLKPRLFTVEQTFGILSPKFSQFFNTFIQGFTRHQYSVRWKVVPLANYGVPQLRRRLIMIGSAPGEKLPPFPPPTHSKGGAGGLKPWVTPRAALAFLRRGLIHRLHRPHRCKRFHPRRAPWDPTRLARTITTNGGQNYYWDGRRDFTLLEYAVLQGFPTWHKFEGSCVKKQIGNAFAPSVVRVLYEHLVDWLLRQDGFDPSERREARAGIPDELPPQNYVSLDDDDEDDNDDDAVPADNSDSDGIDGGDNDHTARERWQQLQDEVDELQEEDEERRRRNMSRLRDVVRRLNQSARHEIRRRELLDLGGGELSDTETLRDDEGGRQVRVGTDDNVVDLTMGEGGGTVEDPYVLSD